MKELIGKLKDLALSYEDNASNEENPEQRAWLLGIALGLRRATLELES